MIGNALRFVSNYLTMIMIRLGWLTSPSLWYLGLNPRDFTAHVTANGIDWKPKQFTSMQDITRDGTNRMWSLDDLPLTDDQKVLVLEWFARKLWVILEEGSGEPDYYGKMYDPLVIDLEEKEAHSYVFHLDDGGRHHTFESLPELEEKLKQEGINRIREMLRQ